MHKDVTWTDGRVAAGALGPQHGSIRSAELGFMRSHGATVSTDVS